MVWKMLKTLRGSCRDGGLFMDHCKRHLSQCRSNLLETTPQTIHYKLKFCPCDGLRSYFILPGLPASGILPISSASCTKWGCKALDQISQVLLMISLHWVPVKFNFWFSPSLSCVTELLQPSVSSRISDQSWSSIPKSYWKLKATKALRTLTSLPSNLWSVSSVNSFKKRMKTIILNDIHAAVYYLVLFLFVVLLIVKHHVFCILKGATYINLFLFANLLNNLLIYCNTKCWVHPNFKLMTRTKWLMLPSLETNYTILCLEMLCVIFYLLVYLL